MATISSKVRPLVVIYGPTGSGKTSLAIRLAKEFDGEIISADSRAIYKGLDIGTAKPSLAERDGVPHWGIDLVSPGELFTAANFKAYANEKIADIRSRNKLPILVGGTGLYMDSIVFDYQFPAPPPPEERGYFESLTLEELHTYCDENNIKLPENHQNKRYVINTILRGQTPAARRHAPIDHCIIVGVTTDKEELRHRLQERAEKIVGDEVLAEARQVSTLYGWDSEAMTANIYPLIRQYSEKTISLSELKAAFITSDWKLAKRQLTWLRRNEYINWCTLPEAYTYCARELVKLNNT